MENFKLTKIQTKVCFLVENKNKYFVSSQCQKKCDALTKKVTYIDNSDLLSEFGKPGFKLCKHLGGKPELVNLSHGPNHQKLKTDKCTFPDESFVSTDYLMKMYISK